MADEGLREKKRLLRVFISNDGKEIKQLYNGEEVEQIVKERKELKDELRSKVEYIHEQDEVVKEYKHRAQVAENELKLYKLAVKIWQERYSDIRCFNFNIALRQAEKELSEEEKVKDYKRLTERENGFTTVRNTTLQGLIDRLAELEDKIESGELCDRAR